LGIAAGPLLIALLSSAANAQTLCVTLQAGDKTATYAVSSGDKLSIAFSHSIYGSRVEEQFRIGATGFKSTQVRYSELRLAEFYGHESAKNENGWWVADNPGRHFPSLDLRVSQQSFMRIAVGDRVISLGDKNTFGDHARVSVSACPRGIHG
jgi:hypothetical protein